MALRDSLRMFSTAETDTNWMIGSDPSFVNFLVSLFPPFVTSVPQTADVVDGRQSDQSLFFVFGKFVGMVSKVKIEVK